MPRERIGTTVIEKEQTMAKDKRFVKVYSQGMGSTTILVDSETGVNYLFVQSGYAGGLTPLLDHEGNVVVSPITK